MEKQAEPVVGVQRRLARRFLVLICAMYAGLLAIFAFFPSVLHIPVLGRSITLGLVVAFVFMLTIFIIMVIYVVSPRRG